MDYIKTVKLFCKGPYRNILILESSAISLTATWYRSENLAILCAQVSELGLAMLP